MAIFLGNAEPPNYKLGNTQVNSIWQGNTKVWPTNVFVDIFIHNKTANIRNYQVKIYNHTNSVILLDSGLITTNPFSCTYVGTVSIIQNICFGYFYEETSPGNIVSLNTRTAYGLACNYQYASGVSTAATGFSFNTLQAQTANTILGTSNAPLVVGNQF